MLAGVGGGWRGLVGGGLVEVGAAYAHNQHPGRHSPAVALGTLHAASTNRVTLLFRPRARIVPLITYLGGGVQNKIGGFGVGVGVGVGVGGWRVEVLLIAVPVVGSVCFGSVEVNVDGGIVVDDVHVFEE